MPSTAIEACPRCGARPKAEAWSAETDIPRETVQWGVTVRMAAHVPDWAAPYALQGIAMVTRYLCPECGTVAAILARDP